MIQEVVVLFVKRSDKSREINNQQQRNGVLRATGVSGRGVTKPEEEKCRWLNLSGVAGQIRNNKENIMWIKGINELKNLF